MFSLFGPKQVEGLRLVTSLKSALLQERSHRGIGVSYDAFFNVVHGIKGYWAYVLITHEMVNLFTGQIVSGGWPVDW